MAKEAAQQAAEAKKAFLATMSHELRTPMNWINWFLQLSLLEIDFCETFISDLKKQIGEITNGHTIDLSVIEDAQKKIKDYNINVFNATQHLIQLQNDLLDFSKLEAGKMILENREINLSEIMKTIYKNHELSAKKKWIKLEISNDYAQNIIWDSIKIKQILDNLISNAIKFTKQWWVVFWVKEIQEKPWTFLFTIQDTWIGIKPEKQENIFNVFEQADNSTTREFGWTWLGLSIVKDLVKLMWGTISLESTPGQGTTFTVEIPLKKCSWTEK
jgi:signal transduction histidine kinase